MSHDPYAVQADMEALWGLNDVAVSSDWDNTGHVVPANVTKALASATSTIDRYVAVRYTVPLQVVPDDLKNACCDIGMYLMCPTATTMTDQKKERYQNAMSYLKDLSTGKVTLGEQQNSQVAATSADVEIMGPPRALTRESMRRLL